MILIENVDLMSEDEEEELLGSLRKQNITFRVFNEECD